MCHNMTFIFALRCVEIAVIPRIPNLWAWVGNPRASAFPIFFCLFFNTLLTSHYLSLTLLATNVKCVKSSMSAIDLHCVGKKQVGNHQQAAVDLIKGKKIGEAEVKTSSYADDVYYF